MGGYNFFFDEIPLLILVPKIIQEICWYECLNIQMCVTNVNWKMIECNGYVERHRQIFIQQQREVTTNFITLIVIYNRFFFLFLQKEKKSFEIGNWKRNKRMSDIEHWRRKLKKTYGKKHTLFSIFFPLRLNRKFCTRQNANFILTILFTLWRYLRMRINGQMRQKGNKKKRSSHEQNLIKSNICSNLIEKLLCNSIDKTYIVAHFTYMYKIRIVNLYRKRYGTKRNYAN